MTIISQSEFSRIVGISRQAIYKAITSGNLPYAADGKKKKIDIDDPAVQLYIKENSIQRERAQGKKKTDIDKLKDIVHPSEHDMIDKITKKMPGVAKGILEAAEKLQGKKKPSAKQPQKPPVTKKSSDIGKKNSAKSKSTPKVKDNKHRIIDDPSDLREIDTSAFDLNQREKLAKTRLAELRYENGKKKNLPTDFIEDALFRHIELLHSNLERYSGIKIKEVCTRAIEDGEVSPKHVEKMVSEMLKIIYNTTKSIEKAIKKYEPKV